MRVLVTEQSRYEVIIDDVSGYALKGDFLDIVETVMSPDTPDAEKLQYISGVMTGAVSPEVRSRRVFIFTDKDALVLSGDA